jgi:very-short-patch-repair endonuclease
MAAYQNNFYSYNNRLQPLANKLRKDMTKAEACLWKYVLRAGQMKGYQFRRQRPVLNFIADFMCKELGLIIEVDGITHDDRLERDKDRDTKLRQAGFYILRFTDEEVLTNIEGVNRTIEKIVEEMEPPPSPPPEGEG